MAANTAWFPPLKSNLSSLTQLRECPEHENTKWNNLPKLHHTVTIRYKNMISDDVHPSYMLLAWALNSYQKLWVLLQKSRNLRELHKDDRTKEGRNNKGSSTICNTFYKSVACFHLQYCMQSSPISEKNQVQTKEKSMVQVWNGFCAKQNQVGWD